MKSPQSFPNPAPKKEISLLKEAVEVLLAEILAATEHKSDDLPELKKRKVALVSHLNQVDWSSKASAAENFDLTAIRTLIAELEAQSRQQIQRHLELIGNQLLALQDESLYWRECMNVSFRTSCNSIPAN
jgi:hypothetical protein